MHEASVVLGLEDLSLQEEVLDFLDRLPRIRVVAAADDAQALARHVRGRRPDAAVVSPDMAESSVVVDGAAVLVVSARETTAGLRAALRAGARGFYLWPQEREALAHEAERSARPRRDEPTAPGRVFAVYGPRGGAGATFLATNLAAAFADRDADTVLADLDASYADVTAVLGVTVDPAAPTISDLQPVAEELTEEHLERVLHAHPRGFRVLLAPHQPPPEAIDAATVSAAVGVMRSRFDAVVLHLPRALDGVVRAAVEEADDVLLVVTLDVLGLRDAKRALRAMAAMGVEPRCRLVLNRVARGEVVPSDAQRVLGLEPVAVVRADRSVPRAQNRGELLSGRSGPAGRRVVALAERLLERGQRR